ncbi:MAG: MBL fold metallo-hydrolase [Nanoarchaeota archaeon]
MKIKRFTLGLIQTNLYLITKNKEAILIDCEEPEIILNYLTKNKLKLKAILLTHGHFDHIEGLSTLKQKANALLYINKKDLHYLSIKPDRFLKNNQTLNFNSIKIKAIFTPGHTKGSTSFYLEKENTVFTGDTLFKEGVGRADLPDSNLNDLKNSLKKLFKLPLKTRALPGHGDETTLENEISYLKTKLRI